MYLKMFEYLYRPLKARVGCDICNIMLIIMQDFSDKGNLLFLLIFRDAVNDLALHFLAKMKIMVVKDIEREDIEFVCKVNI